MKKGGVKVYRDEKGWPIVDCPLGHAMLWLGGVFFVCPDGKAHKHRNQIFVVTSGG